MPKYRCYFTDFKGHFVGAEELESCTLSGAIKQTRRLLRIRDIRNAVGFEIWLGAEMLFTSTPRSAGPQWPGSN